MVSLCFYFQELCGNIHDIKYVCYGNEFLVHLTQWSNKCTNKILDHENAIQRINDSDIIIYQEIRLTRSLISNQEFLQTNKKYDCILIKLPSIYLDYSDYNNSIQILENKEITKNVDIKCSDIIKQFKDRQLMLSVNHPNTFLFLKIVEQICSKINIEFFNIKQLRFYLNNKNYMELPEEILTNLSLCDS